MSYRLAADLVALLHFAFVLFVVFGAFLVLRWRHLIWVHIPSAIWGAAIEFGGWICPLTPLENRWRALAGQEGYVGGFVENYILPLMYPAGLTRPVQIALGLGVMGINVALYAWMLVRARRGSR